MKLINVSYRWLLLALLIFALPVQAGELIKSTEIIRAEFGLFQNNEFIPTDQVPLLVGQTYGWRIELKTNKSTVKWREQFILPKAPEVWHIDGGKGNHKISEDKRVSVIEREVVPEQGVIINAWSVAAGDPKGRYMMRVTVDDTEERVFVFDVKTASMKRSY